MILAENGKSNYRIVVGQNASSSEKHGATELMMFLKDIHLSVRTILFLPNIPLETHYLKGDL